MRLLKGLLTGSYSGDYTGIIEVIHVYLRKNTDAEVILQEVDHQKTNVIAIFGNPKLVINCHTDTVPPSGEWDFEPTILHVSDDKFYGLGTTDVKGSIYALLKAATAVPPKDVMFLFSVDEESGGIESGVTHFLASEYRQNIEKAIVCEPTYGRFVNKHKGYYSFIVEVHTKSGHSSETRSMEDNAIVKAAAFIPELGRLGFNVGKIAGGIRGNVVPAKCELTISIRSYETSAVVLAQVEDVVSDGAVVKTRTALPPFINEEEDGEEVSFWTEAALFQEAGISSLVFGAGNIRQAHAQNEFIEIAQIEKAQRIFEKLFKENQ